MRGATSTLSKQRIGSAFSKGAKTYQELAYSQKEAAKALACYFQPVAGDYLEIGCGTGFLTEEIVKKFPGKLLGIDISPKMVEICREKFAGHRFMEGDGEQLCDENRYDAIFSGMTLQWFHQPKKSIAALRKALKRGGVFYFSYMNERSYPEWNYFPLNPLMNSGILLEEFGNITMRELEFTQEFPNPISFLKEMKQIGAATGINQQSRLKDLLKLSKCGKITITSRITIGYCHV